MTGRWKSLLPLAPRLLLLIVLLLLPVGVDQFTLVNANSWLIAGLLALSLTFIWGVGGIFSFGQTIFFGVAGYTYGIVSLNLAGNFGTVIALVAGIILATFVAAVLGWFMFYGRVANLYAAIITLATTLIFYNLFISTSGDQYKIGQAALGGFNGMQRIPTLLNLDIKGSYWFALVATALTLGSLVWLRKSHFGQVFNAVRVNEERTELLGYDVRLIKLIGFAISGAIAGLAGVLHTSWGNTINPTVFNIDQAILVAIWVIVGGRSQLWGAFLGSTSIQALSGYLSTGAQKFTPLILGVVLVAIVLLLPKGIAPALEKLWHKLISLIPIFNTISAKISTTALTRENINFIASVDYLPVNNSYTLLETQNLYRKFGNFCALNGVNLKFQAGQSYCIIGPNGAGKSTLFNLLTGRLHPTNGTIIYDHENITKLLPHQRARCGISIKLQVPNVYQELTVYENLWLAATVRYKPKQCHQQIAQIVKEIGLQDRLYNRAEQLSHGEKQWLEIGMAAVTNPKLLLLDEPTGGMSRGETKRTVELLKSLQGRSTVIVIEHDMEFVRLFGAEITVLAQGKVFAEGSLETIQQDEQVRAIYLGKGHA